MKNCGLVEQSQLLLTLAEQFISQRSYQQAIQCLTPICSSQSSELPSVLAQARLLLASLLLDHFDNFGEAKNLLLAAEQDVRQTQGNHLLKCEVWDALARCNQKLGAVAGEQNALSAGLKVCRQGATSKDKDALARWCVYFQFKLAEHSMTHQGQEAAAEQVQLLADVQLTDAERALCLLCRATLHLYANEPSPVTAIVEELTPLIEKAGQGDALLHKQLRCHYSLLYIAMVVVAGRINDLKQDPSGNIQVLTTLHKLLCEIKGEPWRYSWLPTPAVGVIGNLLHSSLLRSLGKVAPSAAYLVAAYEVLEQQLEHFGINLQARETQMGVQAIWEGRIYCHLRLLVLEQQVLAALTASRFAQACELLAGLTGILDRFPSLLHDFVESTHMLLGHYAHSLQQHSAASAHFQVVLQSGAVGLHDSAAVAAALAELHADAGPAGMHRAVELLQQRGLTELTHMLSLSVHNRVAALVTNALVARRSGDESHARVMLTKALKTGHAHLGNTQMVAQVLNVLAPIQAGKGDAAGAEQMLGSSTTLATALGDLPSLVCALRVLLRMFSADPAIEQPQTPQPRLGKHLEYTKRKEGALKAAIDQAKGAPNHAALLAWRPAQQA